MHTSFLWLLQEEEGVSFDSSKRWPTVGAGDSVIRYLEPFPREYLLDSAAARLCVPNLFL